MEDTEETLRTLLNKIATEHNYENHEVTINHITGRANIVSKLFTVIIREENKEDLHLFAKVAVAREPFRKNLPIDIFEVEQFAYIKLAKIYASLEEENIVSEEHRLYFTKSYGFDPRLYQETLVLENLLAHGYGPHDRFHSIDWEYASSAVRDLAKMHALSFAFSKQYPEEFEKTLSILKYKWPEFGNMDVMLQYETIVAMRNVKPEYREALEKFMDSEKNPMNMNAPIRSTVIIHGNFTGENLVHRVQENGEIDIKILNLQTLQGGSPVADLIYFIITSSDEKFRAKYYEKLLDHYYTQLSAAMRRLNVDPEETFSREDFDYEIKEKLPFGLAVAVFSLLMLTADSQDTPEVNESVYQERLNGVVNDYVKWGILK